MTRRRDGRILACSAHADGQAMVEYVVVCTVLALALGIGMADENSILWQLVAGFQQYFRNFSYAISLPT